MDGGTGAEASADVRGVTGESTAEGRRVTTKAISARAAAPATTQGHLAPRTGGSPDVELLRPVSAPSEAMLAPHSLQKRAFGGIDAWHAGHSPIGASRADFFGR